MDTEQPFGKQPPEQEEMMEIERSDICCHPMLTEPRKSTTMETPLTDLSGDEAADSHKATDSIPNSDITHETAKTTCESQEHTDNSVDQELEDSHGLDRDRLKTEPPQPPVQNVLQERVLSFAELEQQGAISLQDPSPGYILYPGTFDSNGNRMPFREVLARPQREILPAVDKPLWEQMLEYCQRWGVWVTHIEDDTRRTELMQWVTNKMREAWEFGIAYGHCGKPNGHGQCCLSHDRSETSSMTQNKCTQQRGEGRRRTIDTKQQPAPFACDGSKNMYSITNGELERIGVTMERVLERVTPHDREVGDRLLQEMCERLGRSTLDRSDWTTLKRFARFDSRFHQRNLFMFSLWEVLRCRGIVESLRSTVVNTPKQQESLEKRIGIYEKRADQHLALAVELDELHSESDNADTDEVDQASESNECSKRLTRSARSKTLTGVDSDVVEVEQNATVELSNSTTPEPSVLTRNGDTEGAERQIDSVDTDAEEHDTITDVHDDRLAAQTATTETDRRGDGLDENPSIQTVETHVDHQASTAAPPVNATHSAATDHLPKMSDHTPAATSIDSELETRADNATGTDSPTSQTFAPQLFCQSLQQYAQAAASTEDGSSIGEATEDVNRSKLEYIRQHWQARINAILARHGFPDLKWELRSWSDIRDVLRQSDTNFKTRNQMLREYKAGFADWMKEPRAVAPPHSSPQSETRRVDSGFDQQLQSSRGLRFRYLSSTTQAERDHVDNMIGDYIQFIMRGHHARYGFYAIFVADMGCGPKELAHGVWDLQKEKRPEDVEWFYRNEPSPPHFRSNVIEIEHDWGYSLPPKRQLRRRAAASERQKLYEIDFIEDDYNVDTEYDNEGDGDASGRSSVWRVGHRKRKQGKSGMDHNRGSKRACLYRGPRSRRRRGAGDDSDGDYDWQPDN